MKGGRCATPIREQVWKPWTNKDAADQWLGIVFPIFTLLLSSRDLFSQHRLWLDFRLPSHFRVMLEVKAAQQLLTKPKQLETSGLPELRSHARVSLPASWALCRGYEHPPLPFVLGEGAPRRGGRIPGKVQRFEGVSSPCVDRRRAVPIDPPPLFLQGCPLPPLFSRPRPSLTFACPLAHAAFTRGGGPARSRSRSLGEIAEAGSPGVASVPFLPRPGLRLRREAGTR